MCINNKQMKPLLFLLFLFINALSFAQNIRFEGTVKDSSGLGLEMANVMAVNSETKTMDAYAITNEKGKFILNLKANTTYQIKSSYIGFQTFEKTIKTTPENMTYEIIKEVDVDDRKKYEIEQIELLKPTLNSVKPFLGTTAEYRKSKQWREKCRNHAQKETTKQKRRERDTKNREKLREQIYNYRHANPDKFIIYSERYNVPVECECGTIIINKAKLPRHRKTAKHIKLMKNN